MMKNGAAMEWGIKNDGNKGNCFVGPNATLHDWFYSIYKRSPEVKLRGRRG